MGLRGDRGLLKVTGVYNGLRGLQGVRGGYWRLLEFTRGYRGVQKVERD